MASKRRRTNAIAVLLQSPKVERPLLIEDIATGTAEIAGEVLDVGFEVAEEVTGFGFDVAEEVLDIGRDVLETGFDVVGEVFDVGLTS